MNQGKHIVENIRCKMPKIFYAAVKRATKSANNCLIATEFEQKVDDNGNLAPTETFAEYLTSLYYDNKKSMPRKITRSGNFITITADQVIKALKKLSFGKAVGTD